MNKHVFPRLAASLVLALFAAGALPAQAGNLTADQVMDKMYHSAKPTTSVLTMTMVISKGKQTLTRTLVSYSMGDNNKGEEEKGLMKFLSPGDIKGSGFMTTKKLDGTTESQLWLPAMGKVRRLSSSSSDQDQPFFGSDFTNRDISGFNQKDYTYQLQGFADGVYTIEAKAVAKQGYDRLVYQIDAQTFRSKKVDCYRGDKLIKSQTITYTTVQGYLMPDHIVMSSTSGSSTDLKFTEYKLDQPLGEQYFTERYLKQ